MADPQTPREDAPDLPFGLEGGTTDAAAAPVAGDAVPATPATGDVGTATLRRSPKYTRFLLLGAVFGVVLALILTTAFHGTDLPDDSGVRYTAVQVFGFLSLVCVPVGLVVFGLLALVLDRAAGRRARELTVSRARVRAED